MEIQKDFKELLELFNAHRVEYIVVGGYALAFHGAPRFTGDIDLLVKADSKNAQRILAALNDFGFGSLNLSESDFTRQDSVVQLGVPPVRIDIITSLTGVDWDKAQAGKIAGDYGGTKTFFLGKKEFILNKKALARKKDLADLEALGED
jgi:hypothetical protein